jgi:hypothetical protein
MIHCYMAIQEKEEVVEGKAKANRAEEAAYGP